MQDKVLELLNKPIEETMIIIVEKDKFNIKKKQLFKYEHPKNEAKK